MAIRVVIVEDQGIVRELLAALLAREPGIDVVGQASSGRQALELAKQLTPDVVVLDISLPDMDGISVAQALRTRQPQTRVIALSIHDEPRIVAAMLAAGAAGYVSKSTTVNDLRDAIREVCRGRQYISAILRVREPRAAAVDELGRREREVLALLAEGKRSSEIARRLGISTATVEVHRRNIMRKLDLHSIAELTKYALRRGLTSL